MASSNRKLNNESSNRENFNSESLQGFAVSIDGLLVVGHGTQSLLGQSQLVQLTSQIQQAVPNLPVAHSFLELAEPDIPAGIQTLQQQGVQRFLALPILLFSAGHAQSDIPDAIASALQDSPLQLVGQTPPLELHPQLIELSHTRFFQALAPIPSPDPSRIALVMIGRGTSFAPAKEKMLQLSRTRAHQSRIHWYQTGFFAGGEPNVDQALEEAKHSDLPLIVVQPHLLFEGALLDQLREKVQKCQADTPEKRWIIANPLGHDPGLARLFLTLAVEKVQQCQKNSC